MSPISREAFRDAMAGMAAAVCIVTTDGPGGRYGVTVTACCSVSDDPPTLLVCLHRAGRGIECFRRNGRVALNVLSAGHEGLAERFARRLPSEHEDRFATMPWRAATDQGGSPILPDALVSLWGRITGTVEVATHTVFYVEVEGCKQRGAGQAMVYFGRRYHGLLPEPDAANSRRPSTPVVRLEGGELARRLAAMPGWSLRDGMLHRRFAFDSFEQAMAFMNRSAKAAGQLDHHPSWVNDHAQVEVLLSTRDVQGLSWLDFELAARMDRAFQLSMGDIACAA